MKYQSIYNLRRDEYGKKLEKLVIGKTSKGVLNDIDILNLEKQVSSYDLEQLLKSIW